MDLVVLVPSWCCHELLCWHLLIDVLLPKVTVLQYCHSVTAELLEKVPFDCCVLYTYFAFRTHTHTHTHQNIILYNA